MIDTHAHLDTEAFDEDRSEVINNAFDSGLKAIIIPAIEPKAFDNVIATAESHKNVFCSMGVHPHNASELNDEVIDIIYHNTKNPKVKAIGEIGLDYYYDFNPPNVQQIAFRKQLKLAKDLGLPVIIHNRESDDDMLRILEEEQDGTLGGVLHCFSGDKYMLDKALDLGFYISFTGNITFKKTDLDEVVMNTPIDRLMLETDSPYMTPVPFRGKRNEPSRVSLVAQKIAEIKSINFDEVVSMTTKTAIKFFNLAILMLFFIVASVSSFAQDTEYEEEYILEEEAYDDEELYNPFYKFIGIAPVLGINTIVETWYLASSEPSISYEGITAFGGALNFSVFDFLIIQGSYLYSKNTKRAEENDNIGPNIHQFAELTSMWIANPYSRINFYGMIGAGLIMNKYNEGFDESETTDFSLNTGVGFMVNIPVADVGLFAASFEWRLNFIMERQLAPYIPQGGTSEDLTLEEMRPFYSIPRITLMWYPEFLNQDYNFE
jgi:TatD DNase family protein